MPAQNISISPFLLLKAIRDGRLKNEMDVKNLVFGGFLHAQPYTECRRTLKGFQELGLTQVNENGDIQLTSNVERLVETFRLSPSQMSNYGYESLVVNPVFGRPRPTTDSPEIFVLMPFRADLRPIYEDHIKKVAKTCGLSIARADDFFSAGTIIEEIWSAINAAKIIIADCTGKNPNVFYELGVAHTLGKPVIPISQTLDDVPFDLAHRRAIVYQNTPRGMTDFEERLTKTLMAELANPSSTEAADKILSQNHAATRT